jgi:hypothetical protein
MSIAPVWEKENNMVGKIRITIKFTNGMEETHGVCPIFGYDYHGDFFVVHEVKDGVTYDYPYCLRDIEYITRESVDTVH